jgi:hypothetical protein
MAGVAARGARHKNRIITTPHGSGTADSDTGPGSPRLTSTLCTSPDANRNTMAAGAGTN